LIGIQDAAKIFGIFINLSTGIENKVDLMLFCDIIKYDLSDNITNKTNNVQREVVNKAYLWFFFLLEQEMKVFLLVFG